jgi:hypothetical protein
LDADGAAAGQVFEQAAAGSLAVRVREQRLGFHNSGDDLAAFFFEG